MVKIYEKCHIFRLKGSEIMHINSKRLLSLFLVLMMIITSLPITVFAESQFANFSGASTVIPAGSGNGNKDWTSDMSSMYGYKISVWYAEMKPGTEKNPEYCWGNDNKSFQVGRTLFWRNRPMLKTDDKTPVTPAFWNVDTIYDQTTRGKAYSNGLKKYKTSDFRYEVINNSTIGTTLDKLEGLVIGDSINAYKGYLTTNSATENEGQKALRDWFNRIVDMNYKASDGVGNIQDYESAYKNSKGLRLGSNAETFRLPYQKIMLANEKKSETYYDSEYIKSYFLHPYILNAISWFSKPEDSKNGLWSVQNFIEGTYTNGAYKSEQGQYKIFIEPFMMRPYNKSRGIMTWRDMVSEYKANGYASKGAIGQIWMGVYQLANAFRLERSDLSLKVNDTPLQVTPEIKNTDEVRNVAKNELNGLGVGVLTSPSLFSYETPRRPEIIKTFVEITGVDKNGNVKYETVAPTRMGYAAFDVTESGNITNIASIEAIESDGYNGFGVLNDIFTTDKQLSINKESTVWENTDLPKNIGYDLSLTADDIAGYNFGILTDSDVFVEAVMNSQTYDDNFRGDVCNNVVQATIDGMQEANSVNAASALETTYIMPYIAVEESEGNTATSSGSSVSSASSTSARDIATDTIGETAEVTVDTPDGGKVYQVKRVVETVKIVESVKYENYSDIILGKINEEDGMVYKISDEDKEKMGITTPANTIVLRYIVIPAPKQFNVIEVYNETTGESSYLTCMNSLNISDDTVYIEKPNHADIKNLGEPQLIDWVTNSEKPTKDISNNVLPNVSANGLRKTDDSKTITNYPVDKPITHNLYVKWKIVISTPPPYSGSGAADVPQWRLSRYFAPITEVSKTYATMTLPVNTGCCGDFSLSPTGTWKYSVKNPNEEFADTGSQKLYTWLHSKAKKIGSTTISEYKTSAMVEISGSMTAIKSTDTTGLKAARWITDSGTINGLSSYDISTDYKSNGSSNTSYTAKTLLGSELSLDFGVYNNNSYTNTYAIGHWSEDSHWHTYNTKTITPSGAIYTDGILKPVSLSFARYNQKETSSISVSPSVKEENAYTSYSYQSGDTMKVYPEYGMLFANDSGSESIKWVVGDKAREIKPVFYQTMRFKVYVQPNSTGSSMATDSRALTARNKISDSTAKNKQIIYKGSNVNTAFQLYRDSSKNTGALLTVKTFALDYNDSKGVQSVWGMDGYKPEKQHTTLLSNISTSNNATAYEKLFINNDGVTYNGGVKQQQTNDFTIEKYSGKDYVTKTHELIIRGGQLIGVKVDGESTPTSITALKSKAGCADIYQAIIESKLYNESNDKSQTVLSSFEHKATNSDVLVEDKYATMLQTARQSVDGIATPDNAKINSGDRWYSEDTTVLVLREYVSNFKVPSISFSDKLSLQITGLNTPVNKTEFFNKVARGHIYLKYELPIKLPNGDNTKAYFEYDSLNNPKMSSRIEIADRSLGYQGTDYIVPNVSITDTIR